MGDALGNFLWRLGKVLIIATVAPIVIIVSGLGLYLGYEWLTYSRYVQQISAIANDERDYPAGGRICKEDQTPIYPR